MGWVYLFLAVFAIAGIRTIGFAPFVFFCCLAVFGFLGLMLIG